MTGQKFDSEKDRWDLLDTAAAKQIVKVLTHGARVYGDENWRHVPAHRRRYYAAAMRHLAAWREGNKLDDESGLPHLAHAAVSLIFLLARDDEKEQAQDIGGPELRLIRGALDPKTSGPTSTE